MLNPNYKGLNYIISINVCEKSKFKIVLSKYETNTIKKLITRFYFVHSKKVFANLLNTDKLSSI